MSTITTVSEPYAVKTHHASLREAIAAGKYAYVHCDITNDEFELSR